MVNFIKGSAKFISTHFLQIILAVLVFFLITSYIVLHNITFPKHHHHLEKVLVVENYQNKLDKMISGLGNTTGQQAFCENQKSDPKLHDGNCRSLGEEVCHMTGCCVWAEHNENGPMCVSGDALGVTFNPGQYSKVSFNGAELNI